MDDLDDIQATLASVKQLAKHLPREPEQLPLWPKKARGAPSVVARSALFSVVKRGQRKHYFEDQVIASWKGHKIAYRGAQLDQRDFDCWLQLLHLAKEQPLETDVYFTAREFLKGINKVSSKGTHKWLWDSIGRLQTCLVTIERVTEYEVTRVYRGQLVFDADRVDGFKTSKGTRAGIYRVKLNAALAQLFDNAFVRLNADKRAFLRSDLAKWLQGYVQSHRATAEEPHRIRVDRLQELSGSQIKTAYKFKQALKGALGELREIGAVKRFVFSPRTAAVEWVRPEPNPESATLEVDSATLQVESAT